MLLPARGAAVTFASAAALTLGVATVPVYEVYKAGATPSWAQGLDLLSEVGLTVALIPHYDNAEGGNHDTHFCYMGERRLRMLEREKEVPFEEAPMGTTGLETAFAAVYTELVLPGVLPPARQS